MLLMQCDGREVPVVIRERHITMLNIKILLRCNRMADVRVRSRLYKGRC